MGFHTHVESPLGPLLLLSDGRALTGLYMNERTVPETSVESPDAEPFGEVRRQLEGYFAGERRGFDLPLAPRGTTFQRVVWAFLREVPYGETISYGELARRIRSPKACRAVGLANGQNPLSIVVPCHRVVGANGKLTGYGGGLANKAKLLDLESGLPLSSPRDGILVACSPPTGDEEGLGVEQDGHGSPPSPLSSPDAASRPSGAMRRGDERGSPDAPQ